MDKFKIGDKVVLVEDDFECGLVGSFGPENFQYQLGQIYEVVDDFDITDGYWIEQGKVSFSALKDLEHCFAKSDNKAEQVHSPKHDVVNNPKHYQLIDGFEVKDLMKLLLNRIENSDMGFTHFQSSCYKEAMQYFLRFMLKNGQEDIQKGVYYMNEVLKEWEGK